MLRATFSLTNSSIENTLLKQATKHFKFFKGCFPQILLGSFLDTLTHRVPVNDL